MLSPDDLLRNWFDLLAAMQSVARNLNSDTESDLGEFAGQNVADLLQTPLQRQTFEQQMASKLRIADSDLDGATTFENLLENAYNGLDVYVLGVFQDAAGISYGGMSPGDFGKQLLSQVNRDADAQQSLIARLESDMRDAWFPDKQDKKADRLRAQFTDSTADVAHAVGLVATRGLPR